MDTVTAPVATPEPRILWTAGPDRVEHAHSPSHEHSLCGLAVVDATQVRPGMRRCMGCTALLNEILNPPELIQRAEWGDR